MSTKYRRVNRTPIIHGNNVAQTGYLVANLNSRFCAVDVVATWYLV